MLYITTNLINGKKYVGERGCDCDPKKDKYLGSGTLLIQKIKECGKENFKKEILELFETKKEAFDAQNGYNISWKGGHGVKDCISEETKLKLSIAGKGKIKSEDHKQKIRESVTGK
jgi:hypothetical protein